LFQADEAKTRKRLFTFPPQSGAAGELRLQSRSHQKESFMPLVPCRACGHQVDTSALACPGCGATNPGHKFSSQQRNLAVSLVQFAIVAILLAWGGWFVWKSTVPLIKEILSRPQVEQTQNDSR
jgi:hypothetical protein